MEEAPEAGGGPSEGLRRGAGGAHRGGQVRQVASLGSLQERKGKGPVSPPPTSCRGLSLPPPLWGAHLS